jgi:cytochrome c oxidase subunit 2
MALAAALFIWMIAPPPNAEPNPNQPPGARVFQQYCAACHTRGTSSCPRLEGLADRPTIAGGLVNTPDNLRLWIQNPRAIRPSTAMPTLPLTDQQLDDLMDWILSTY